MSRILPFNKPTWDYSLWEKVRSKSSLITEDQVKFLSTRDRGGSAKSDFWKAKGRRISEGNSTMVVDFIGLSRSFDQWFTMVDIGRESLLEEFSRRVNNIRGSRHLEGFDDQWLEINWTVLGQAIGSAIANEGHRKRWWQTSGYDARTSNLFWIDMERASESGFGFKYVDSEDWEDMLTFFRERNFDPSSEIRRSAGHRPSAPIFPATNDGLVVYTMNPLVSMHRDRMRERFRQHENPDEFARFHGELTFGAIRKAMEGLNSGDQIKFAFMINGICSAHIMRSSIMQQKIGMHLFSNLAVRMMTRGVEAVNVPDIAQPLATGFGFGKVLEILYNAGLIEWYTVELDDVNNAISELKKKS